MQSNGGLADAANFRGKDAILSGPAGGVVGMVAASNPKSAKASQNSRASPNSHASNDRLIGFDMGGTSTDVTHYAGEFELTGDTEIAGVRIAAPMMHIHTVAAGGGSICSFDGIRFQVGPHSAGADPGPACYRKGGPLTVTDCNLYLGRIDPAFFPKVFGPNADQGLDLGAARSRLEAIAKAMETPPPLEDIAEGFLAIATDNMANAIRKISLARGYDVTRYSLVCFGGAGGQHAARVADALGMERVLIHPLAGMLSAYGIALAPVKAIREKSLVAPLTDGFAQPLESLERAARNDLLAQGIAEKSIHLAARAKLRFEGSDSVITLPVTDLAELDVIFRAEHRQRFGYSDSSAPIITEALSVEASSEPQETHANTRDTSETVAANARDGTAASLAQGAWPVFERAAVPEDGFVTGPALIIDPGSTTVVEPGWQAQRLSDNNLVLTRHIELSRSPVSGTKADPIRLEIFGNLFMAIAEEMGVVLRATATSVNIKERLDFSCAVFDASGALIANAPHIPVHLGSMGDSIKRIIEARGMTDHGAPRDGRGFKRGDAYVLNDPYRGGTHLPDVTVIMPVFYEDASAMPDAFVAARGHHSDIGGIAPGSMPPDSTSLAEEGVLLDNILMVDQGAFQANIIREVLATGPYPARSPERNLSDLRAQLAACTRGSELLCTAAREHGVDAVQSYMEHMLDHAEQQVRKLLSRLEDGNFTYAMDSGAQISVSIRIDRDARSAVFDFTGTSPQQASNFNAPRSITRAAALYVLRTLIDDPIPMNDGCLRPVTLVLEPGSMLDPRPGAAVVAGNVETSQVITDTLFAATGRLAPSQGTMNNFTFGNDQHQYYETIAGGSGAGIDHNGTDAVQTHMTNSRLTDPEILETRLPVRLDRFAIRRGSGGVGAYTGGDGVEREVTFLEPMRANMLANRRTAPPKGICGGEDAKPGRNWVERTDGTFEELPACAAADMQTGDRMIIHTPGGAGYGRKS